MKAIIVASGQSAMNFIPPADVKVVAVNGSIDWLARADYWFTLDPSPENMRRMQQPKQGVQYYAAVEQKVRLPPKVHKLNRLSKPKVMHREVNTPKECLERYGGIAQIQWQQGFINSGNSVWGAFQLALQFGFTKILLVGVDADQENKIDGKKPGDLRHLPLLFESAVGKVEFANVGKMHVDGMPRFDEWQDGIDWLFSV